MAIFLSYSRHDEDTVKTLASGLEAAHRQVWIDNGFRGGDAWERILAEIRETSVFVFALSNNSLGSKPCIAELAYAEALSRPILPVQVGPVGMVRANPLAARQIVNYRPDEANTGFEVLNAVDAAARRVTPLPYPLPAEPPIPFAYLQGLRRHIDATELNPGRQGRGCGGGRPTA